MSAARFNAPRHRRECVFMRSGYERTLIGRRAIRGSAGRSRFDTSRTCRCLGFDLSGLDQDWNRGRTETQLSLGTEKARPGRRLPRPNIRFKSRRSRSVLQPDLPLISNLPLVPKSNRCNNCVSVLHLSPWAPGPRNFNENGERQSFFDPVSMGLWARETS